MEIAFRRLMRWLGIDVDFEVRDGNYIELTIPIGEFDRIVECINNNVTLYNNIKKVSEKSYTIDENVFIDGYWCRTRLQVLNTGVDTKVIYRFLGYLALVGGSLVLVDSRSSMVSLED